MTIVVAQAVFCNLDEVQVAENSLLKNNFPVSM